MIFDVDDAWAEDELERQLRSLTPIDCLEDAERKLNKIKVSIEEDTLRNREQNVETETEQKLPDSVETFFSLIQHASGAIEKELVDCQTLIDKQVELTPYRPESDTTEAEWEEELHLSKSFDIVEEDTILSNKDEDDDSEPTIIIPNKIQNFRLQIQTDLPMYQDLGPTESLEKTSKHEELRLEAEEKERKRIEKEKERNEKLEEERLILEQLQEREIRKIEEEMLAAEKSLQLEMFAHEKKMEELTEQHELETKQHKEEQKRREKEMNNRKHKSATIIQAHFRGMRTRRIHKEDIQKRINQNRNKILEEQLLYYEEAIRQEKAAVEAEIEKKRIEEEKKKKSELRAEELRIRHLEKEQLRKVEEQRKISDLLEIENTKEVEEEERAKLMYDQKLHWLNNTSSDDKVNAGHQYSEAYGDIDADVLPDHNKKVMNAQDIDEISKEPRQELSFIRHSDVDVLPDQNEKVINVQDVDEIFKESREELSFIATQKPHLTQNSSPNINTRQVAMNINNPSKPDNYNLNQDVDVDNKQRNSVPENDNAKKSKPSFFENISSKAKNLFKQNSSNEKASIDISSGNVNEIPIPSAFANNGNQSPSIKGCRKEKSTVGAASPPRIVHVAVSLSTESIPVVGQCIPVESDNLFKESETTETTSVDPPILNSIPHQSTPIILSPVQPPRKTNINHLTYNNPRLGNENPLLLSLDSALSTIPSKTEVFSSLDLPKASFTGPSTSQFEAKAEYRRKKKLREEVCYAREVSDVSRKSVLTSPAPDTDTVDWEKYVTGFVESFARWRDSGSSWDEKVKPPSTAGSGRFMSRNLSVIEPRTFNETTVVENVQFAALQNPDSREVYISDSTSLDVSFDQNCKRVELLSFQRCKDTHVNIIDSKLKFLYQNDCGVSKLEKVPWTLLLMDLNRNDINRLNPVSCSNLVVLMLSHNALVSTRGLQYLPNLVSLDLSYNSLSTVQHIDKCGLLQQLDLSHNQLVNIPSFHNNILLSTLDLSANGLTNIENLSKSWLPCLQKLKLVANGLSGLPVLYSICPLLKWLDVSNNMLSETQEFINTLKFCRLQEVACEGTELDQQKISGFVEYMSKQPPPDVAVLTTLASMQQQLCSSVDVSHLPLQQKTEVLEKRAELSRQMRHNLCDTSISDLRHFKPPDVTDVTLPNVTDEMFEMQGGKIEGVDSDTVIADQIIMGNVVIEGYKSVKKSQILVTDAVTRKSSPEQHDTNSNIKIPVAFNQKTTLGTSDMPSQIPQNPQVSSSNGSTQMTSSNIIHMTSSIVGLQSLLRGFRARLRYRNLCDQKQAELYREYQRMSAAALLIQKVWKGFSVRKMLWRWLPWLHRRQNKQVLMHKCATKIQAVYRGYLLRRRLDEVFQQAVYDLSDCDDIDEVCSLNFDDIDLERGWGLPPTPSLKNNTPLPPASQKSSRNPSRVGHSEATAHVERSGTHISQGSTAHIPHRTSSILSHRSGTNVSHRSTIPNVPVPLLPLNKLRSRESSCANSIRSFSDVSVLSLPASRRTTPSKRHRALVEEWGVKDAATAQKLIQRSKKFGKHISTQKKREMIRDRIIEGSRRNFTSGTPPPPTATSGASSGSELEYQWDIPALRHPSPGPTRQSVPVQVYRNARFNEPAGKVKLPPLTLKRNKQNKGKFK